MHTCAFRCEVPQPVDIPFGCYTAIIVKEAVTVGGGAIVLRQCPQQSKNYRLQAREEAKEDGVQRARRRRRFVSRVHNDNAIVLAG